MECPDVCTDNLTCHPMVSHLSLHFVFCRAEREPVESRDSQHLQPGQWDSEASELHAGPFTR